MTRTMSACRWAALKNSLFSFFFCHSIGLKSSLMQINFFVLFNFTLINNNKLFQGWMLSYLHYVSGPCYSHVLCSDCCSCYCSLLLLLLSLVLEASAVIMSMCSFMRLLNMSYFMFVFQVFEALVLRNLTFSNVITELVSLLSSIYECYHS